MTKDVPDYFFPVTINDSGKSFRALLEHARKMNGQDPTFGGSFPAVVDQMEDFAHRFGEQSTRDAGAIAIAYLAYLIEAGVIEDPLANGTYR